MLGKSHTCELGLEILADAVGDAYKSLGLNSIDTNHDDAAVDAKVATAEMQLKELCSGSTMRANATHGPSDVDVCQRPRRRFTDGQALKLLTGLN